MPEFIIKLAFGEGSGVMLDAKDVYPRKLLESGFEFRFDRFEEAFKDIVG